MPDLKITLTISEARAEDAKEKFLKALPRPKTFEGTDLEWIKSRFIAWGMSVYKRGRTIIAREAEGEIPPDLIS